MMNVMNAVLKILAEAEKFSNGKKNFRSFPSRHFRGSFAFQFWERLSFSRRRFLEQELSLLSQTDISMGALSMASQTYLLPSLVVPVI